MAGGGVVNGANTTMGATADEFGVFLDQFRVRNDDNVARMVNFGDQLRTLSQQYRDACRDLERERVAGRHAQERAERSEQSLEALRESVSRSAFVLVLIDADADAYLFDDKYYRYDDPAEGGSRAAVDLCAAARQYLQATDGRLAGLPVMAKAFASGEGLANLFVKAGVARESEAQCVVSRFTSGFSQGDDMFDFVLVGRGKDRADHKLMASFRQFVENPSCQHVLLGGCHDNGYVRMLERCAHVPEVTAKVTLVKSFQTGREFSALPFPSTTMESVFRSSPLPSPSIVTRNSPVIANAVGSGHITAGNAAAPGAGNPSTKPPTTNGKGAASPATSPATTTSYASRAAALGAGSSSGAGGAGSRPVPMVGKLDKGVILVNSDGQRVDAVLPPVTPGVAESMYKATRGGKRYCNMFNLAGSCSGSSSGHCTYSHEPLTASEKLVLRHKLRAEKCHDRSSCRDAQCVYGHHCACLKTVCRFPPAMHNVNVSTWREVVIPPVAPTQPSAMAAGSSPK